MLFPRSRNHAAPTAKRDFAYDEKKLGWRTADGAHGGVLIRPRGKRHTDSTLVLLRSPSCSLVPEAVRASVVASGARVPPTPSRRLPTLFTLRAAAERIASAHAY